MKQNVDHRRFTPLVMSVNGGSGRERKHFYTKLSEKILKKKDENYSVVAAWVRQKITSSLINVIISCTSESRTVTNNEEIIIRSLSESIKTSELLSEINLEILTNINSNTYPLHQSM